MKWKRLPRPTSLSTQMRPSISPTSRAAMARPRPGAAVAAGGGAVGLLEHLEDRGAFVRGNADARVADREVQDDVILGSGIPGSPPG